MLRLLRLLAAGGLCLAPVVGPTVGKAESEPPRWHQFSGLDVTPSSTFLHHGVLWGVRDTLHAPGWRLRGVANAGAYRYRTDGISVTGRLLGLELAPGYTWFNSRRGLSVFLGAAVSEQATRPFDVGKPRQGTRFGGVARIEGWMKVSDRLTIDVAADYSTLFDSYSARVAGSVPVGERFSLEPEVVAFGEPGYDQQRFGLLVGFRHSPALQVLAGGGVTRDPDGTGAYLTVQLKRWH